MTPLAEWATFCEVLGSAAGALTGLQFLLVALLADMPAVDGESDVSDAFATPTVVHFVSALVLAATLAAPWHSITAPAAVWGVWGGAGLVYTAIVVRRMLRQKVYKPSWKTGCFTPFCRRWAMCCLLRPHASPRRIRDPLCLRSRSRAC